MWVGENSTTRRPHPKRASALERGGHKGCVAKVAHALIKPRFACVGEAGRTVPLPNGSVFWARQRGILLAADACLSGDIPGEIGIRRLHGRCVRAPYPPRESARVSAPSSDETAGHTPHINQAPTTLDSCRQKTRLWPPAAHTNHLAQTCTQGEDRLVAHVHLCGSVCTGADEVAGWLRCCGRSEQLVRELLAVFEEPLSTRPNAARPTSKDGSSPARTAPINATSPHVPVWAACRLRSVWTPSPADGPFPPQTRASQPGAHRAGRIGRCPIGRGLPDTGG
jgi:hypothetical protein